MDLRPQCPSPIPGTIDIPAATPRVTLRGRLIGMTIMSLYRMSEAGSTTHRKEGGHKRLMATMAIILPNIRARYRALISLAHLAKLIDPTSITFSQSLASMVAVDHLVQTTACLGLDLGRGTDLTETIDASNASTTKPMRTASAVNVMRAPNPCFMNRAVVVAAADQTSHGTDDGQMASLRLRPP
jgi:hypothetical protein